jgi:hypothetical protein
MTLAIIATVVLVVLLIATLTAALIVVTHRCRCRGYRYAICHRQMQRSAS